MWGGGVGTYLSITQTYTQPSTGVTLNIYLTNGLDSTFIILMDNQYNYSELNSNRLHNHQFIFSLSRYKEYRFTITQIDNLTYTTQTDPEDSEIDITYFTITDLGRNSRLVFTCSRQ